MNRSVCRYGGCDYPQGQCDGACMRDWLRQEGREPDARRVHDSLTAAAICLAGMVAIAVAGVLAALLAHLVG